MSITKTLQDNQLHHALFTLPPIQESIDALPAEQELPTQKNVTGDKEVDAVLWLREVISSGQPGLIATAMEAAKKIKTPLKELEERYALILRAAHPDNPFATISSMFFANLGDLASSSILERKRYVEAVARFPGDTIWSDTPAEQFCKRTLKRCRGFKDYFNYDKEAVAQRFRKHSDLMPHSLTDCLHELRYWNQLYRLRKACGDDGDGLHEAIAREWFVTELLKELKPRSHAEALAVHEWMIDNPDSADGHESAIYRNLLDHPGISEVRLEH